jgi:hypothetical protein
MDDLRSLIQERCKDHMKGNWSYIYTHLTHIEDIEVPEWTPRLDGTVGEIEIASETYSVFLGVQRHVNKVMLMENGTYTLRYRVGILESIIKEWMEIVKKRYWSNKIESDKWSI